MLERFEAYQAAKRFYRLIKALRMREPMKEQLLRASSSIALNVAEASGKRTLTDKKRYFTMAFGSARECQAILDLEDIKEEELLDQVDRLAAMLYALSHR